MLLVAAVPIVVAAVLGASNSAPVRDTSLTFRLPERPAADTPRVRPRAVEVSEWYGRRLTIHRTLSYTVIPIFGAQWFAGERIYKHGGQAPGWGKKTHPARASALAGYVCSACVAGALWHL